MKDFSGKHLPPPQDCYYTFRRHGAMWWKRN